MVDGGDEPGQAEAEEHVDAVGAGDVADGHVGVPLLDGGCARGEGVRQGGAQRHERNGCRGGGEIMNTE